MGDITVTRVKSFVGAVIKYFCVLNMSESDFNKHVGAQEKFTLGFKSDFLNDSTQICAVANGETVTIPLGDGENTLFVAAFTSTGRNYTNTVKVTAGKSYSVKTKMGLTSNQMTLSED